MKKRQKRKIIAGRGAASLEDKRAARGSMRKLKKVIKTKKRSHVERRRRKRRAR